MYYSGLLSARLLPVAIYADTDVLSVTNYLFGKRVCRDRFNLLNRLCNIKFDLSKQDKFPVKTDRSIADIIDETACRLVEKYDSLTAMWSGGVDSTCAVSALIKNGVCTKEFSVICSKTSIEESPFFYDFLHKNNIRLIVADDILTTAGNFDTEVLVTGCCADQLFGHAIHRKDYSLYNLPWIDAIDKIYTFIRLALSERSLEMMREYWQHYARALELELTQFCEFAWLYNFGIRWSLIYDSVPLQFINTKNKDKFFAFFSPYDFQCWSVSNFEHIKDYNQMFDNRHYKVPLKQYTYTVVKDDDCFLSGKHVSNIVDKKHENQIAIRETDGYTVYDGITLSNYERRGIEIGNRYRKQQALL